MRTFKITTLPGDGIGPEVMDVALAVLDLVGSEYGLNFEIKSELAGGASLDQFNEPITESALQSCLESDVVPLGAVGGPKWDNLPQEKKPERGLLKLREVLGLYSNLRPAKIFAPLADASSLKKDHSDPTQMIIYLWLIAFLQNRRIMSLCDSPKILLLFQPQYLMSAWVAYANNPYEDVLEYPLHFPWILTQYLPHPFLSLSGYRP